MRLRQEIQEMLRAQLIATAAFTGGLQGFGDLATIDRWACPSGHNTNALVRERALHNVPQPKDGYPTRLVVRVGHASCPGNGRCISNVLWRY